MCSDLRDRVFALFSPLVPYQKDLVIQADYTKSTLEVYLEFIQGYINKKKDFEVLRSVEKDEEKCRSLSWVPDWSARPTVAPLTCFQSSGLSLSSTFFGDGDSTRL